MRRSFPSLGHSLVGAAIGATTAALSGLLVLAGLQDMLRETAGPALVARLLPPVALGALLCGAAGLLLALTRSRPKAEEGGATGGAAPKASCFDTASAPMLLLDREHGITHANPAFLALLDRHLPDFRGFWPGIGPDTLAGRDFGAFRDATGRPPPCPPLPAGVRRGARRSWARPSSFSRSARSGTPRAIPRAAWSNGAT